MEAQNTFVTRGVPHLSVNGQLKLAVILTKLDQTSSSSSALLEMPDTTKNELYDYYILPRLN